MNIEEAAAMLGYVKCDWPPEEGECESCWKTGSQDYGICTSPDYEEYEYRCAQCVIDQAELQADEDKEVQ